MTVLVTGGYGFIGHHLVNALETRGIELLFTIKKHMHVNTLIKRTFVPSGVCMETY